MDIKEMDIKTYADFKGKKRRKVLCFGDRKSV